MTNQPKTIPHLHIKLAGTGFGIQMHKRAFLDDAIAGAKELWRDMDDNERTALTVGGLGAAGAGVGGIFGGLRGALAGGLGGVGAGAAIRGRHVGQLLGLGKKPVDIDPRTVGTPMGGTVRPGAPPRKPGQNALDAYRAWDEFHGDSGNLGEPAALYDQIGGFNPTEVDPAIADSNVEAANVWNQDRLAARARQTNQDWLSYAGGNQPSPLQDGGRVPSPADIVAEGVRAEQSNRFGELGSFEADPYQPHPLTARLEEGLQQRREQIETERLAREAAGNAYTDWADQNRHNPYVVGGTKVPLPFPAFTMDPNRAVTGRSGVPLTGDFPSLPAPAIGDTEAEIQSIAAQAAQRRIQDQFLDQLESYGGSREDMYRALRAQGKDEAALAEAARIQSVGGTWIPDETISLNRDHNAIERINTQARADEKARAEAEALAQNQARAKTRAEAEALSQTAKVQTTAVQQAAAQINALVQNNPGNASLQRLQQQLQNAPSLAEKFEVARRITSTLNQARR